MTSFRSACGACKFLRRKCDNGCIFAPYFDHDEGATHFAAVHKVFGASNISKLLRNLPVHNRSEAAITISYEALARMQNPVYGCVGQIFALRHQVAKLQEQLEITETQYAASAANFNSHQNFQVSHNIMNGKQPSDLCHATNGNTAISVLNNNIDLQNPLCEGRGQSLCFDSINEWSSFDKIYEEMNQEMYLDL
ncbi:hypothetical protein AQUCO_00300139v1 [Aquilegia coerulea]|uniref:LOB domain-containing protein n=1 Tax=Aquilegia coerulea TaxID=218851 RepID=A0A2G5EXI5_AQUCA|nr:hypothetical protein AQUCO_00300139v1 [Aquilegia coerulea]